MNTHSLFAYSLIRSFIMNHAISRFPAIVIGGPPHTGKSVLAKGLKDALKQADVAFYHFSATPDGEGDWFQETSPEVGQALRQKQSFTSEFVTHVCRDIAGRPLPFLIDVGGKPKPWQQQIFDHCTHAILLVRDQDDEAQWVAMMNHWDVTIIAVLYSQPKGEEHITVESPILQGIITELERHQPVTGKVFEALLKRVKALFRYQATELFNLHSAQAPLEWVVNLRYIYQQLYHTRIDYNWQPKDVPNVLNYLPNSASLALYGVAPTWLYGAVAAFVAPQSFYQFDSRLGWVEPISIERGPESVLQSRGVAVEEIVCVHINTQQSYLAYQPLSLNLPHVAANQGVIFSCKLPFWVSVRLVLLYQQAAWVALYEPRLSGKAVVVASTQAEMAVGQVVTVPSEGLALFQQAG